MGKAKEHYVSKVRESELHDIKKMANFPSGAIVTAPHPDHKPELVDPDTCVFYTYTFDLGHKFPFLPLTRAVLSNWDVNPGQLGSQAWRILALIEYLTMDWVEEFAYEDLMSVYGVKRAPDFTYSFKKRVGCDYLVIHKDVNDRKWKESYVFVAKSSLGEAGDQLRGGWNYGDLELPVLESEGPRERVAKFLKIPRSKRTFSRAYPPPYYNLTPGSPTTMAPQGVSGSEEEILKRAQCMRRKRGGPST